MTMRRGGYKQHEVKAGRPRRTRTSARRALPSVGTANTVATVSRRADKRAIAALGEHPTLTARTHGRPLLPSTAHGHIVHRTELPNGLRVITVPQLHLHTATIAVWVKVGSRYESPRENGLSHLLEHMLFRGSQRYPSAYLLNREIEELGGTLHGATHSDSTLYEVTLPPAGIARGIEILGEIFTSPALRELAIEKRIVREEILEYLDDAGREIDPDNLSRQLLYGTHPLGSTITGDLENLERFDEAALRAHMRRHYVGSNIVLCVAGAVDERAVFHSALAHFGRLPTGAPKRPLPAPPPREKDRFRYVHSPGPQSDLRLSFPTFGASHPRYLALELLVRVIDDGMSTRLHRRVCEELGLAYEVFASLEPYEESGVLDVGAAVEHCNVPVFVRTALHLLDELTQKLVSKAELDKAKRRYKWQLEAILDDAQAMCAHYGQRTLASQDGHIGSLREQVDRITVTELRAVAREVFCRERLHLITVGLLSRQEQKRVRRAMAILPRAKPTARRPTRKR